MSQPIYLDHNSTSPITPTAAKAVFEAYEAQFANPASQHRAGQKARTRLETYRREIIQRLGGNEKGMDADKLVFTSGGTESDNLALFGLSAAAKKNSGANRVLISSIEHPAVFSAAKQLARLGYEVHRIPVCEQGVCDLAALENLFKNGPSVALVSIMLANNETGAIQPIRDAAAICHQYGAWIHTDAVQAVGKLDLNFNQLGVDALTLTAHKMGGPRGIGGLLLKHSVVPEPVLFGGFQQMAMRPGTEDVALTAGFHAALLDAVDQLEQGKRHLQRLRDRLQDHLCQRIPGLIINSQKVARTPQTLNLALPGINRQTFLMSADMASLAISTGSACASGSSEPSPVLLAMNRPKEVIDSSIRISVGWNNTLEEIDLAVERIIEIVERLKK